MHICAAQCSAHACRARSARALRLGACLWTEVYPAYEPGERSPERLCHGGRGRGAHVRRCDAGIRRSCCSCGGAAEQELTDDGGGRSACSTAGSTCTVACCGSGR